MSLIQPASIVSMEIRNNKDCIFFRHNDLGKTGGIDYFANNIKDLVDEDEIFYLASAFTSNII